MEKDIKRSKACFEHRDYYAMLLYISIIISNYSNSNKIFFLNMLELIKKGNYEKIEKLLCKD